MEFKTFKVLSLHVGDNKASNLAAGSGLLGVEKLTPPGDDLWGHPRDPRLAARQRTNVIHDLQTGKVDSNKCASNTPAPGQFTVL